MLKLKKFKDLSKEKSKSKNFPLPLSYKKICREVFHKAHTSAFLKIKKKNVQHLYITLLDHEFCKRCFSDTERTT